MDTESCKVLVQTDDAGRVTAINSDTFGERRRLDGYR